MCFGVNIITKSDKWKEIITCIWKWVRSPSAADDKQGEEVWFHGQILIIVSDIKTNSYTMLCSRECESVCALTTNWQQGVCCYYLRVKGGVCNVSIYMGGTTYSQPNLFASNYLTWSHRLIIATFCVLAAWFARSTTREVRGRPHKVLPFWRCVQLPYSLC